MIALGNNAHIFARPHRREELARCFAAVVGGSSVMIPGGQVFTIASTS
jgi:hypothetical protein